VKRDYFDTWRRRLVTMGQRDMANTIRRLVYMSDPAIFDTMDFDSDAAFLHPFLFAHFTAPVPTGSLEAVVDRIRSMDTQAERAFPCIQGTTIRVLTDTDPLLARFFVTSDGTTVIPDVADATRDHIGHFVSACSLVRALCPSLWLDLRTVLRCVVLFRANSVNSFATQSAQGVAFCNVGGVNGGIALVEDIVHQGAHVLFNALTHSPRRVFRIKPNTPVAEICSEQGDPRSAYEALHGLFTYTLICRALTSVWEAVPESGERDEALARLGFTLQKFGADLAQMDHPNIYAAAGQRCHAAFSLEYRSLQDRYSSLVQDFDYANQPYVFDYGRFVEYNGRVEVSLRDSAL